MRILTTVVILSSVALSLTGCDFFRSMVGKPTSAELEQMRIEAQKKADREKFVADSIKAALEAQQLAAQAEKDVENLPEVTDSDPRFHVIVGCFKVQDNASSFRTFLERNGYTPKRLIFRNGYDVVSIFQTDTYGRARSEMEALLEQSYCPDDIWIYDLQQGLHE